MVTLVGLVVAVVDMAVVMVIIEPPEVIVTVTRVLSVGLSGGEKAAEVTVVAQMPLEPGFAAAAHCPDVTQY